MSTSLVIADDHYLVRLGIKALLKGTDIAVVAEAASAEAATVAAEKYKPNVIMMDVRMTAADDSFAAVEKIKKSCPDTGVLMFSNYDNPSYVGRSIICGASNYLLKGCDRDQMITAIQGVADGEEPENSGLFRRVQRALSRPTETMENVPVTRRELQILRHVALGLSNRQIAQSCGISIETVKEHVQNILRKLDVSDRTAAAVWAVKHQVV